MLPPHGGKLVNREPKSSKTRDSLKEKANSLKTVTLKPGEIKHLQNIAHGSYSPLKGFMGKNDLNKVVQDRTLEDGTVWTVPIILDIPKEKADQLDGEKQVTLLDRENRKMGILDVEEIYTIDKEKI